MKKFSMEENWEIYSRSSSKKEKEQALTEAEAAKKAAENFVLSNIDDLEVAFISEEGEAESSLSELERAINQASTAELQAFLKTKYVPFEDGTIIVFVK